MNTLDPNIRVPIEVRERLGIPIPVDVRFGMDAPTDPLDEPGGYRYEISAEDRAIFEAAIEDTRNSDDFARRDAARAAITEGLKKVSGFAPLGTAAYLGAQAGFLILDFLGFFTRGSIEAGEAAVAYAEHDAGGFDNVEGGRINGVSAVVQASWRVYMDGSTKKYEARIRTKRRVVNWFHSTETSWTVAAGFAALRADSNGTAGTTYASAGIGNEAVQFSAMEPPKARPDGDSGTVVGNVSSSVVYRFWVSETERDAAGNVTRNEYVPFSGPLSKEEGLSEFGGPDFDLGEMEPGDFGEPDYSFSAPEAQDLIDKIKDSPWMEDYGREAVPPPAEPPPTQPPPPTGPPHPSDPGWPCGGGIPGGPGSPGGGLPSGPGDLPGGGLPGVPGGPGAGDFPGVPGGPGRIRLPGGPGPGLIEGPPFPCDDPRYYPGSPIEAQIGEKTRKGRIAASDCENGIVIPEFPPFADENFSKPWCRNNILVVDAVKELAEELGMSGADWAVDEDCKERWTGCFAKGSSKFDAMWALSDMCGYGLFPPGEEIGPMKPLPVFHGPYHEARDFWGYTTQKDSMDIPSHVEVFKPNVNGRGGFSIVLPVRTPYVPADAEKWYSEKVGPGVTRTMAENIALKKKAYFQIRAVAHNVVVPYLEAAQQRHQITLQRPSQGYTERAMIVSYEHEVDMESGAITKLVVSELSRQTYPRRDETFEQAWGTLEGGINIPRTVDRR